ncbi:MAG: hypothetical protein R3C25_05740 [Hyphomonadaceae bacterium]
MWWLILAGLSGSVVIAVAAWARGSRQKAEAEEAERRERRRLQMEETALLARLKRPDEGQG